MVVQLKETSCRKTIFCVTPFTIDVGLNDDSGEVAEVSCSVKQNEARNSSSRINNIIMSSEALLEKSNLFTENLFRQFPDNCSNYCIQHRITSIQKEITSNISANSSRNKNLQKIFSTPDLTVSRYQPLVSLSCRCCKVQVLGDLEKKDLEIFDDVYMNSSSITQNYVRKSYYFQDEALCNLSSVKTLSEFINQVESVTSKKQNFFSHNTVNLASLSRLFSKKAQRRNSNKVSQDFLLNEIEKVEAEVNFSTPNNNRTAKQTHTPKLFFYQLLEPISVELCLLLHKNHCSTVWFCTTSQHPALLMPTQSGLHQIVSSLKFCNNLKITRDTKTVLVQQQEIELIVSAKCLHKDQSTKQLSKKTSENHFDADRKSSVSMNVINSYAYPGVVKILRRAECTMEESEQLLLEAELLAQIYHPHVVTLYSIINLNTEQWIFLEHAPLGDLYTATHSRVVSETTCKWILFQILLALKAIHSEYGVVHCDVKPHNVLLFEDSKIFQRYTKDDFKHDEKFDESMLWSHIRVKLSDLGLAQKLPKNQNNKIEFSLLRGTYGYLAPELLMNTPYNEKVDIWAVGVLAFSLIVGYPPFYPSSSCLHEKLKFDPRYWSHISVDAKNFLQSLLMPHPDQRVTASEALEHPWLTNSFLDP